MSLYKLAFYDLLQIANISSIIFCELRSLVESMVDFKSMYPLLQYGFASSWPPNFLLLFIVLVIIFTMRIQH